MEYSSSTQPLVPSHLIVDTLEQSQSAQLHNRGTATNECRERFRFVLIVEIPDTFVKFWHP